LHLFRIPGLGEVASTEGPPADGLERARLRAQVFEVGLREGELRLSVLWLGAPDEDEPVLVPERQRVEDDAVHDREHGAHATNPDRQGQDGDQGARPRAGAVRRVSRSTGM
jgi:hypothetical protein